MRRLPLLSIAVVSFAPAESPALEPPPLILVWHDSSRLFPAVGLELLGKEIEELFRANRLPVRFHAAVENENLSRIPEPRVNVLLLPEEGGRFGVPPNAMAAAHGERGEKYTIFVFFSGVRRTLGHRGGSSPRQLAELSLALARIVAHEVVHVLAPERGHADSGLMSGALARESLLAKLLELDEESLESVRGKLESLGKCEPSERFQISKTGCAPLGYSGPGGSRTCPFVR